MGCHCGYEAGNCWTQCPFQYLKDSNQPLAAFDNELCQSAKTLFSLSRCLISYMRKSKPKFLHFQRKISIKSLSIQPLHQNPDKRKDPKAAILFDLSRCSNENFSATSI